MWQVDDQTPFAAECGGLQDCSGVDISLLAMMCSFDIRPDGSTVAFEEQLPLFGVAEYCEELGKGGGKMIANKKSECFPSNGVVGGVAGFFF